MPNVPKPERDYCASCGFPLRGQRCEACGRGREPLPIEEGRRHDMRGESEAGDATGLDRAIEASANQDFPRAVAHVIAADAGSTIRSVALSSGPGWFAIIRGSPVFTAINTETGELTVESPLVRISRVQRVAALRLALELCAQELIAARLCLRDDLLLLRVAGKLDAQNPVALRNLLREMGSLAARYTELFAVSFDARPAIPRDQMLSAGFDTLGTAKRLRFGPGTNRSSASLSGKAAAVLSARKAQAVVSARDGAPQGGAPAVPSRPPDGPAKPVMRSSSAPPDPLGPEQIARLSEPSPPLDAAAPRRHTGVTTTPLRRVPLPPPVPEFPGGHSTEPGLPAIPEARTSELAAASLPQARAPESSPPPLPRSRAPESVPPPLPRSRVSEPAAPLLPRARVSEPAGAPMPLPRAPESSPPPRPSRPSSAPGASLTSAPVGDASLPRLAEEHRRSTQTIPEPIRRIPTPAAPAVPARGPGGRPLLELDAPSRRPNVLIPAVTGENALLPVDRLAALLRQAQGLAPLTLDMRPGSMSWLVRATVFRAVYDYRDALPDAVAHLYRCTGIGREAHEPALVVMERIASARCQVPAEKPLAVEPFTTAPQAKEHVGRYIVEIEQSPGDAAFRHFLALGALSELLVRAKLPSQTEQRLREIVTFAQREGPKPSAFDLMMTSLQRISGG